MSINSPSIKQTHSLKDKAAKTHLRINQSPENDQLRNGQKICTIYLKRYTNGEYAHANIFKIITH